MILRFCRTWATFVAYPLPYQECGRWPCECLGGLIRMDMATGNRMRTRTRVAIGLGVAILALLVLTTTAFAAGPFGRFQAGNGKNGNGNMGNRGFGPEAIVTAVDTTAQTITLAGVPQQIATVKVDSNVKLTAIQPDGTA